MSAQVNVASKAAIKISINTVAVAGGGGGVTAHSALTGLTTGDDHTQYLLSNTAEVLSSSTTLSGAPRLFIVVDGSTFTMPATTPSSYLGRPWTFSNASDSTVTLNAGTSGYLFNGTDQTATLRKGRQIQVTLVSITGLGTLWGTGSLGPVPVDGGSIGVNDLIAGTNVTLTPSDDNQQVTISATGGSVNSVSGSAPLTSTGTSSVVLSIPAATTAVDGYMTSTQATKLAGVATGATANSSDATLLARANHTGTQALSTISDAGTAAAKNAPATGNASATEVVLGSDTRLTDARTPTDGSVITAKIVDSAVTSAKIADGTIVNGDISASAAIATSKISGLTTVATDVIFDAAGDLPVGTGADTSARLAKGNRGEVLATGSSTLGYVRHSPSGFDYLQPTAADHSTIGLGTTVPIWYGPGNQGAPTSGRIVLVPIQLDEGVTISSIAFTSGTTAGATLTNQWFVLCNSAKLALAYTTNDTSTAWASNTRKQLSLASTYTTTYRGRHYLGILITATTVPSLKGLSQTATGIQNVALACDTGLTTPGTAGTTAYTAASTGANIYYGEVA